MRKKKSTTNINSSATPDRPWSGQILYCALGEPGGPLVGALQGCAAERGHMLKELASELGVTYGYISQLRSDLRSVQNVSDDFARKCAKYLGVPLMQVWVLAGKLQPSDLYPCKVTFASQLANAIEFIGRDKYWGHQLTTELRSMNADSQHMLVKLYQKATGCTLLTSAGP